MFTKCLDSTPPPSPSPWAFFSEFKAAKVVRTEVYTKKHQQKVDELRNGAKLDENAFIQRKVRRDMPSLPSRSV